MQPPKTLGVRVASGGAKMPRKSAPRTIGSTFTFLHNEAPANLNEQLPAGVTDKPEANFSRTGLYQGTTTRGCDKPSRGCFWFPYRESPGLVLTRMLNRVRTGRWINPQYLYELRNLGKVS